MPIGFAAMAPVAATVGLLSRASETERLPNPIIDLLTALAPRADPHRIPGPARRPPTACTAIAVKTVLDLQRARDRNRLWTPASGQTASSKDREGSVSLYAFRSGR